MHHQNAAVVTFSLQIKGYDVCLNDTNKEMTSHSYKYTRIIINVDI